MKKVCACCHKEQPMIAFPLAHLKKDGTRKGDGYRSVCRKCESKKQMDRRKAWTKSRQAAYAKYQQSYMRGWLQRNPWYTKTRSANFHAKRAGASGVLQISDVKKIWKSTCGKCWICGDQAEELDHFRPINKQAGGTNTTDNVRPICKECNQKRSYRWHGEATAMKEARLLRQLKTLLKGVR